MKEQWHLDKSVSVGHILTTVIMIGAFMVWMMAQSSRITKLETQQTYNDDSLATLHNTIQTVDNKVDQILIRLGVPQNGT